MERRIGSLRAEVVDPESAKFTAPLLLLHGLWSTPAIWRPFTGYLAHRGWLSVAPHLELPAGSSLSSYQAAIAETIAALPSTPIIIGHDLGCLFALRLADRAAAVVALAPLLLTAHSHAFQVVRAASGWLARFSNRPGHAPRGRWQPSYPSAHHPRHEPSQLLDELNRTSTEGALSSGGGVPTIVIAGDRDEVTPPDSARALATQLGAELRIEAGAGHALPVDPGWDERVSSIHRWIVQSAGLSLLALFDEAFEDS